VHLSTTIPALPVESVVDAVEYYTSCFGFEVVHLDPDGFAVLARDHAEIHLWQASDDRWRVRADLATGPVRSGAETFLAGTASCRVHVDDVDALYGELSAAGVLHPSDSGSPVDTEFGTREFATLDRDGNLLTFFRRLAT
jgi:uncharacterized glyoxalase superfamily protein PhnB